MNELIGRWGLDEWRYVNRCPVFPCGACVDARTIANKECPDLFEWPIEDLTGLATLTCCGRRPSNRLESA